MLLFEMDWERNKGGRVGRQAAKRACAKPQWCADHACCCCMYQGRESLDRLDSKDTSYTTDTET